MSTEMQYLSLTDAMGYRPGPQEQSPSEYAELLRKDAERYRWLRRRRVDCWPRTEVADDVSERFDDSIDRAMAESRAVGAA